MKASNDAPTNVVRNILNPLTNFGAVMGFERTSLGEVLAIDRTSAGPPESGGVAWIHTCGVL